MLPAGAKKACDMTVRKDVDCSAVWVAWQLICMLCERAVQDKTRWQDGSCEHITIHALHTTFSDTHREQHASLHRQYKNHCTWLD